MHVVLRSFALLAIVLLDDAPLGHPVRMGDLSNPVEYLTAERLRYPGWALVEGDVVGLEPRIILFPDNYIHDPTPWAVVTLRVTRVWTPPDLTDTTVTFLAHNCYFVDSRGKLKASRWEGAGFIYPGDHLLIHLRPLPAPSPPPAYQYTIPDELRGYRFAGRFWLMESSPNDSTTLALFVTSDRPDARERTPEMLDEIRTAPSHTLLYADDVRQKLLVPVALDSLRRHLGRLLGVQTD